MDAIVKNKYLGGIFSRIDNHFHRRNRNPCGMNDRVLAKATLIHFCLITFKSVRSSLSSLHRRCTIKALELDRLEQADRISQAEME